MFGNLFQVFFLFNHSRALGPGATLFPLPKSSVSPLIMSRREGG